MIICLSNIHLATQQQIFDQVTTHLLTQNARSLTHGLHPHDRTQCLYRSPLGLKCAAGCLISDEEYRLSFEHRNFDEIPEIQAYGIDEDVIHLILVLQTIHDTFEPDVWLTKLTALAEDYNFDKTVLLPFQKNI